MTGIDFRCPVCKERLLSTAGAYSCRLCGRSFEVVDGIPDFFVSESDWDDIDEKNKTWTLPEIVEARDTYYNLCLRELKGMAFCMQEMGKRTFPGCRVLEVGMGTGHFTRWLAEASMPGTEIYAFDFSWPVLAKAKAKTASLPGIAMFRANARGRLPFRDGTFDVVFCRLAPLGPHDVPNVQAAFELLKPGGWYFEAAWYKEQFEAPPTEWAVRHGFESAEHHTWQYQRVLSQEEYAAKEFEWSRLAEQFRKANLAVRETMRHSTPEGVLEMVHENLLIARKPLSQLTGASYRKPA